MVPNLASLPEFSIGFSKEHGRYEAIETVGRRRDNFRLGQYPDLA